MKTGVFLTSLVRLGAAIFLTVNALPTHAQAPDKFPHRPVKWLVPSAAGVRAPAAGYNLLSFDKNASTTNSVFYKNLNYNAARDFRVVATPPRVPVVLAVPPDHPAKSYKQFIDGSVSDAGQTSYASPGVGSPQHIGMEMLQSRTGVRMLHVPCRKPQRC